MKLKLLLLTALMAGSSLLHGQQNDRELKRFLLGSWVAEQPDPNGLRWEITFLANGQFLERNAIGSWISGTWDVQAGVVFYHIIGWYPNTTSEHTAGFKIAQLGNEIDQAQFAALRRLTSIAGPFRGMIGAWSI
jgi:hypothetical protein